MATISASPRVAPLRWSQPPAAAVEPRSPVAVAPVGLSDRPADGLPTVGLTARDRRLVVWILAVFVGTLVFSGPVTQWVSAAPVAPGVVSAPAESAAFPAYTVAVGDTMWDIARGIAPQRDPRDVVAELRNLNGLPAGHVLQAGEVLLMPITP